MSKDKLIKLGKDELLKITTLMRQPKAGEVEYLKELLKK